MKKFKIQKNKKVIKTDLTICHIKEYIKESHKKDFKTLIENFNKEYTWNEMFKLEDVEKRIKERQDVFILYYKNKPIGYVFFKHLDNETCFGYNLYVMKKTKRPKYSAYWFYKNATEIMLSNCDNIEVEVEDWNWVIIDIIENIGYFNIN